MTAELIWAISKLTVPYKHLQPANIAGEQLAESNVSFYFIISYQEYYLVCFGKYLYRLEEGDSLSLWRGKISDHCHKF